MTDRPILFSAPMVRALLDGRKTMTRRVLNRLRVFATPESRAFTLTREGTAAALLDAYDFRNIEGDAWTWSAKAFEHQAPATRTRWNAHLPYAVGDRLWVREAWADEHPLAIQQGRYSQPGRAGIPGPPQVKFRTIYRADGEPLQIWRSHNGHPYFTLDGPADDIAAKHPTVSSNFNRRDGKGVYWNSPIHMPRWASRLTLTVTAVKVERLQDISEEDARAEGAPFDDGPEFPVEKAPAGAKHIEDGWDSARDWYADLWNPDAWEANPGVAAITFTVGRHNIDEPSP